MRKKGEVGMKKDFISDDQSQWLKANHTLKHIRSKNLFIARIARNIRNGTAGKSVCGLAVITAMCRQTGSVHMGKR